MPLHPRLAHMLERAGRGAATIAALMSERDPMPEAGCNLWRRVAAIQDHSGEQSARLKPIRDEANRLAGKLPRKDGTTIAQMAALAYPDRIGLRRKGDDPRWVLSGGKGVWMRPDDDMAAARMLVVTDTDGQPREARVRMAIEISEAEVREMFSEQIEWQELCHWDKRARRVVARRQECLGALILQDRLWKDAPTEELTKAMLTGVRVRRAAAVLELPEMNDSALLEDLDDWLLPHLSGVRTAEDWAAFDVLPALRAMLDWEQTQAVDQVAPAHYTTPLGRKIAIDYASDPPEVSLRLQEVFGETRHPMIAGQPLRLTLLSPAGRPVQTTTDLPGFWTSSYADVRKDMRGRYPKHPWPEDPTRANPTLRAKRRG